MTALQRKLWRDLWRLRGQTLAIALVVIGGISTLVMATANHQALSDTRQKFYEQYAFADVFAGLRRAPVALLDEVRALPGVQQAEGRIVVGMNLDMPGFPEAVTAVAVSLSESASGMNRLYLRSGRLPEHAWEVVIGEAFAEAHRLHPGDPLHAIVNGRRQQFQISGIGLSPEFIYQIRPGDVFPDFSRFTVLWMQRQSLASAYDLSGAFNQVALTLVPGMPAAQVIDQLDHLLRPYGGQGAHDREQQLSHRFLNEELKQLEVMTRLFSAIFLSVTAFLLNVVLGRLIGTQRAQIAVLKAFGYTRWEVGRHYASLVLLMVGMGVLPGMALGAWMGHGMANLYMTFYRFPFLEWSIQPSVWAMAIAFPLTAAALGTASGLARVFRLQPAEAMRPESPPVYRTTLAENLGLDRWLDAAARMVLRNLERRPLRSLLSMVGIGLACGILIMSRLQSSAIDEMIAVQFGLAQRDDLTVVLNEPASWRAVNELAGLPGVMAVEAFRVSPVKLHNGHLQYSTVLQGLQSPGDLRRVLDDELRSVTLPEEGLMLTDYLAKLLQVRPGDTLEMEFTEGRREVLNVPVVATTPEYLGVGVYAHRTWVNRLLREDDAVSGMWLKVAPQYKNDVLQAMRERPRVAGVSDRAAAIDSFYDTMAESILTFTLVITLMASSIAVGVVYNAARITLSERARDLASLRILGYTRQEVRRLLLGELATLTVLALPPGFVMGYGMGALLVAGFESDLYRVPLSISPPAFALAAAIVLAASGLSGWLVARRLDRLDLVAVLKTQE